MQEFILPIRAGMTKEKAADTFPDLRFQSTDKALYFDMFTDYSEEIITSIKAACCQIVNH